MTPAQKKTSQEHAAKAEAVDMAPGFALYNASLPEKSKKRKDNDVSDHQDCRDAEEFVKHMFTATKDNPQRMGRVVDPQPTNTRGWWYVARVRLGFGCSWLAWSRWRCRYQKQPMSKFRASWGPLIARSSPWGPPAQRGTAFKRAVGAFLSSYCALDCAASST